VSLLSRESVISHPRHAIDRSFDRSIAIALARRHRIATPFVYTCTTARRASSSSPTLASSRAMHQPSVDEAVADGSVGGSTVTTSTSAGHTSPPSRLRVQTNLSGGSSPVAPSPRRLTVSLGSPGFGGLGSVSGSGSAPGSAGAGFGALASPRKVASNVSTFKLANFVLGFLGSPCPPRYEPAFNLALDNTSQIVTVTSQDKDHGGVHYSRHLAAIHSVHADPSDPKRLTITFRDGSRPGGVASILVKIYAMALSEARMILELLQLMLDEYAELHPLCAEPSSGDAPERDIADTDIIYIGRVLKRGKMSWAPRWLVLKKFHLRVYKTNKLHVPSNNISLSGAKITTNEEKDKHLTLSGSAKKYTLVKSRHSRRSSLVLIVCIPCCLCPLQYLHGSQLHVQDVRRDRARQRGPVVPEGHGVAFSS
jgi:hypothetical protein